MNKKTLCLAVASVFILASFCILLYEAEESDAETYKCEKCGQTFYDWDSYYDHKYSHLKDAMNKTDKAIEGVNTMLIFTGIIIVLVCGGLAIYFFKKNKTQ